jgi:CheY-like chemotaxis protein
MDVQRSFHSSPSDSAPRILSVDDEPGILHSRELLLQYEGYHVLSAPDSERALKLFEGDTVDVVLLDYLMPGMDGGSRREGNQASATEHTHHHRFLLEAMCMMTAMSSAASTPFRTAAQKRALMGLMPIKLSAMPISVETAITA